MIGKRLPRNRVDGDDFNQGVYYRTCSKIPIPEEKNFIKALDRFGVTNNYLIWVEASKVGGYDR